MVEVFVSRVGFDSASKTYVVVLQEKNGRRVLPIWIGQLEAESIVVHVQDIKHARPLTQDLCQSLIQTLGATLRRVLITQVVENTYYAEMHIDDGKGLQRLDARPSDGISIALRLSAPILVDEPLLTDGDDASDEEASTDSQASEGEGQGEGLVADELKAYIETLRPEDLGELNL